ncbi:hypothetical protein EVAR_95935_1 [Eumeta japonica]|uniref:Uncharacterized protein n=1 Tax=Eumeta variegata TaxID=151549 RepID=A0A4C1V7J8_EUMVA|nr:hypothetical protein EVAR_95935_1 [Eumeta japonica]
MFRFFRLIGNKPSVCEPSPEQVMGASGHLELVVIPCDVSGLDDIDNEQRQPTLYDCSLYDNVLLGEINTVGGDKARYRRA